MMTFIRCFNWKSLLLRAIPVLLFAGAVQAQATSPIRIAPPPPPSQPSIQIIAPGARTPLRLFSVVVDGDIAGSIAQTQIELTIFNPNNQVLEGELQFPLLDGQTVSGFALDINGEMRPAVPVEKTRGQQVFEDTIRQRIDPALLEATAGNNYKLRVYPIPANGERRVRLEISQTLTPLSGQKESRLGYQLPLLFAQQTDVLDIQLRLPKDAEQLTTAHIGAEALPLERGEGRSLLALKRAPYSGAGLLQITFAATAGQPFVTTQAYRDEVWFYAELPETTAPVPRPAHARISLLWDASGSGARRDHDREFALLDAWLRKLGNVTVELVIVRDVAEAPQGFSIKNGDWRALRKALEAVAYDGATRAGAMRVVEKTDMALLFTDGLFSYGEQDVPASAVPLFIAAATPGADAARLSRIAQNNGGMWLDLLQRSGEDALGSLTTLHPQLVDLGASGADKLLSSTQMPENGRWKIAGRMKSPGADVRLEVKTPDGRTHTRTLRIDSSAETKGLLAAQRWGRMELERLGVTPQQNRATLQRTAAHFSLVTADTSLIVLDSVADYVQHGIEPPPSLRAQYDKQVAYHRQTEAADKSMHLENIVRRFNERIQWWEKPFPKGELPKAVMSSGKTSASRSRAVMSESEDVQYSLAPPAEAVARAPATMAPLAAPAASPSPATMFGTVAGGEAEKAVLRSGEAVPQARIQLKRWQPDAPYARRLCAASAQEMYAIYLDERPGYADSTAFFLDAADIFLERGQTALGLRILSNLAEMNLENRHILRILGYRLQQAQQIDLAIPVFERVLALSPNEPQSWRDLALAQEQAGQHQQAVENLWEVVSRPWHDRFPDVELIALGELNAIIARAKDKAIDTSRMDERLLRNLPLDLRVILSWDADNTDIDLWVTDPNGEKALFSHPLTWQGGRMSRDFTRGYGPEEFALREAKPGKYVVQAQFFGQTRQIVAPATTLMLRLTTGFGTPQQKEENIILRLSDNREVVTVGEFEIE